MWLKSKHVVTFLWPWNLIFLKVLDLSLLCGLRLFFKRAARHVELCDLPSCAALLAFCKINKWIKGWLRSTKWFFLTPENHHILCCHECSLIFHTSEICFINIIEHSRLLLSFYPSFKDSRHCSRSTWGSAVLAPSPCLPPGPCL